MCAQHVEAQYLSRPVRQQLADGHEVTLRLRHLRAFDLQEAVVHPEIRHHRRVKGAARLRDFVLVVRKHEIDAAAVDVERLAQVLPRHRRALDVPARPPGRCDAAGRGPRRLARLRWLPQHEIPGIALVGRDLDARARDQLVERALGKLAVVRHGGHAEQHVLLGDVGVARSDETLDQRLHLFDMLGRARLDRGRQAAERGHVLVKLPVGCLGQAANRLVQRQAGIFLGGARDDLVVDVGDVAHVGDVIGAVEMAQQAEQDVEDDDRARVADMSEVVDGRAAHIHARARGIERPERPLLAVPSRPRGARQDRRLAASLAGRPEISGEEKRRPQPAWVASE